MYISSITRLCFDQPLKCQVQLVNIPKRHLVHLFINVISQLTREEENQKHFLASGGEGKLEMFPQQH